MNKMCKIRGGTVCLLIALLAVLAAGPATAADQTKKLKGDYAVSISMTCATSTGTDGPQSGFDPVTLERLGPGLTFNAVYQGVTSFDGKGEHMFTGEVLVFDHDELTPVAQYDLACLGPYSVSQDMIVNSEATCEVLRVTPGGPPLPPGVPVILSGARTTGRLFGAKRGIIMLQSDTEPNIETYSLPEALGGGYVADRICGKSGTAVRIWN